MTTIPYVAVGPDELGEQTEVIACPRCKEERAIVRAAAEIGRQMP